MQGFRFAGDDNVLLRPSSSRETSGENNSSVQSPAILRSTREKMAGKCLAGVESLKPLRLISRSPPSPPKRATRHWTSLWAGTCSAGIKQESAPATWCHASHQSHLDRSADKGCDGCHPDPMRANSASVTLYTEPNGTPRAPLPPAIGAGALILIRFYRASRAPETSEAAVLVWFWLVPWQSPRLVPFRGRGDGDSRADVPELHAGVAAADQPVAAGPCSRRHLLRLDLADQRVTKKEVWNVN